jgi:hypothetical protein
MPLPRVFYMERYGNRHGDSPIRGYEVASKHIDVKFADGTYRYSYARAGRQHVERMKELARRGEGLATYISRHVHDTYDTRF